MKEELIYLNLIKNLEGVIMKMNTKKLVLNSVLLGIGLVLHQIEPAIFGVKPDMTLIMLFTIMILNKDS